MKHKTAAGSDHDLPIATDSPSKTTLQVWLAFVFGVIFLFVMLYLATVIKNPEPFAIRIYITALALAAGGVGAILPGFFDIQHKGVFRAGGAIGLVLLVYLNEPAIGTHVVKMVRPASDGNEVVQQFLEAIDSGNPTRSWQLLSTTAREQVGSKKANWDELYKNTISTLVPAITRQLVSRSVAEAIPGLPSGIYSTYMYKTKFSNDTGNRAEAVVLRANSAESWEIYSYQVSLQNF